MLSSILQHQLKALRPLTTLLTFFLPVEIEPLANFFSIRSAMNAPELEELVTVQLSGSIALQALQMKMFATVEALQRHPSLL